MTRMQLKALVKECLVEILQEGLGGAQPTQANVRLPTVESKRSQPQPQQKRQQSRISPLDLPAYPNAGTKNSGLMAAIKTESRGDPVMADILADTAMTTLPKMMGSGDSNHLPSAGPASQVGLQEQFVGTPEQVFGEDVASKWANLAFMDAPSKKLA